MTTDNIKTLSVDELNKITIADIRHFDAKGNILLIVTSTGTQVFRRPTGPAWVEITRSKAFIELFMTTLQHGVVELGIKNRPIHWYTKCQDLLVSCEHAPSVPTRIVNRQTQSALDFQHAWDVHDKGWRIIPLYDIVTLTPVLTASLYKELQEEKKEEIVETQAVVGE